MNKKDLAEYILVDLHHGQSEYNFFGNEGGVAKEIENEKYSVIYQKEEVYLLKRK